MNLCVCGINLETHVDFKCFELKMRVLNIFRVGDSILGFIVEMIVFLACVGNEEKWVFLLSCYWRVEILMNFGAQKDYMSIWSWCTFG